ncbi:MAG: NAD(P)-dependent oxidoreductase [Acetobacteraceae bacterium]|nr:NAD(P)-dependent oxidoreductase [Acetobacteraceae bacterium]
MTRTVLITGARGNLGTKLRAHFSDLGWTVRLLDVRADGDPAITEADLSVYDDAWARLATDADAIVHFAGNPSPAASWASVQRLNIDLTQNVYEAAARHGARRVVFASSNWTMAGHRFAGFPLTTDHEPAPVNPYGVSKLIGERIGRAFAEHRGVSSISFRIGYCQTGDNLPGPHMGWGLWGQRMWLSNRDLCQAMERAVLAEDVPCAVLNLMSDNPGMRWDIETTRRTIGYAPRDAHTAVPTPEITEGEDAARATRDLQDKLYAIDHARRW